MQSDIEGPYHAFVERMGELNAFVERKGDFCRAYYSFVTDALELLMDDSPSEARQWLEAAKARVHGLLSEDDRLAIYHAIVEFRKGCLGKEYFSDIGFNSTADVLSSLYTRVIEPQGGVLNCHDSVVTSYAIEEFAFHYISHFGRGAELAELFERNFSHLGQA